MKIQIHPSENDQLHIYQLPHVVLICKIDKAELEDLLTERQNTMMLNGRTVFRVNRAVLIERSKKIYFQQ